MSGSAQEADLDLRHHSSADWGIFRCFDGVQLADCDNRKRTWFWESKVMLTGT